MDKNIVIKNILSISKQSKAFIEKNIKYNFNKLKKIKTVGNTK